MIEAVIFDESGRRNADQTRVFGIKRRDGYGRRICRGVWFERTGGNRRNIA
jgi:hypothetical protein